MSREERKQKRRRRRRIRYALLLLLALLLADSRWRIVTTEYVLRDERLPEGFEGFRILQLSDLHGDLFGKNERVLLRQVKAAAPDVIVLTGDLIDEEADLAVTEKLLPALQKLAPCYYVTGNHEWASKCLPALLEQLERAGVTPLRNEVRTLERGGDELLLVGVDDPNGRADMIKPDALCAQLRLEHPETYQILLGHRNYWPEQYPALAADLVLCGHAHGGIVRLPGGQGLLGTDRSLFPENTEGVVPCGSYNMVVSRGLGNVRGSLRLFNNPQLVLVRLQRF